VPRETGYYILKKLRVSDVSTLLRLHQGLLYARQIKKSMTAAYLLAMLLDELNKIDPKAAVDMIAGMLERIVNRGGQHGRILVKSAVQEATAYRDLRELKASEDCDSWHWWATLWELLMQCPWDREQKVFDHIFKYAEEWLEANLGYHGIECDEP